MKRNDDGDSKRGLQRLINHCNRLLISIIILLLCGAGFWQITSTQAKTVQGDNDLQTSSSQSVINSLTMAERAWLKEHPVIRVAEDPERPPIEFNDKHGNPSGITADYLKIIEQRLGVNFEVVHDLTWQESYERLKRWEIDMTASVSVTPERTNFWTFTKPYMKIPIVIITAADVTYISSLSELSGKKVAVVDDRAANDWLPKDFPDVQLVRVKSTKDGLETLQRGKVFAYIDNMMVAGYHMAMLKATNIKITGETPYVNAQCMAIRKDWSIFSGILQKALDSITDAERDAIYYKWMPIRYEHGFDYTLLWYALTVFVLILSGMAGWNWKLGREIKARKEAEAALDHSEEKFKIVFESANVGKSLTLPTGEINVNQAFCDMLGYTREELINKRWQDLTPPIEIDATQKIIDQLLQGNKDSARFNKQYVHKNGSFVWADVSVAIRRDVDGNPLFLITTVTDITERKRAMKALQESEEHYHSLFNNMLNAFQYSKMLFDQGAPIDFIYLDVNNAFYSLIGVKDVIGKKTSEILPGIRKLDPELFEILGRVALTGNPERFEIYVNALKRWFRALAYSLEKEYFVVIFEDITDRKHAEEALQRAHERLLRFIDSNIVGVIIAAADGKVIEANDYYLNLIGFTREEFESGKVNWRTITPAEWLPADEKAIRELREKGTCTPYEKEYQRRDGTRISLILADTMLPGPEEQIAAFALDITESKQAEYSLRENERKLQEAQEMAHLGFWNWDIKTGAVEWSEEVFRIFCLDPKEFTPHIDSILALSPWPEDHQREKEIISTAIQNHDPGSYEQKFLRPDQSIGHYFSTFQGKYDEKGELISIVGTVLDITERKRTEETIHNLNAELELRINERTNELQETIAQLEELNRVFVGRELKMAELKERIAELEKK
jgi:PAS domain S-box-containing protein